MDNAFANTFAVETFIGMNDHPSITFHFDTMNFHDPDTKWFLDELYFDGCRVDCVPMSFYQDIIDFCQHKIKQIPHFDAVDGELEWNDGNG